MRDKNRVTYSTLITAAIRSSPHGMCTITDILKYITYINRPNSTTGTSRPNNNTRYNTHSAISNDNNTISNKLCKNNRINNNTHSVISNKLCKNNRINNNTHSVISNDNRINNNPHSVISNDNRINNNPHSAISNDNRINNRSNNNNTEYNNHGVISNNNNPHSVINNNHNTEYNMQGVISNNHNTEYNNHGVISNSEYSTHSVISYDDIILSECPSSVITSVRQVLSRDSQFIKLARREGCRVSEWIHFTPIRRRFPKPLTHLTEIRSALKKKGIYKEFKFTHP
ncbi:hypothetical protein NEPAR06_2241 [Nematocida parisii]|uniref:Uncharacterized protein n=1 Tax=Nematocida parisii (strain ERTm3) TaxID=935791 RepID=I3EDX7_NEMP3|nr:uncharacterized protein NEPG_00026 [Nematocida parisii ERTm1]EIJ87424.1 hypothetical protein NEQG_02305 [Nematocida parisii ERTm3]KAI5145373.1 hypothetical protein NEPAR07_1633 [Nematocida parisii]EIJ94504.1 hypothetical protein NEPG_00026 [Nematocida parisii ERTm1]KAI5156695.1 hypothetical protein NEPAR06_2241 [Nematocida parisii]KAI5157019.1 hypothetical protein NEPAR05_0974 [Nematocida parisii]|eukprot:XP_013057860.1 hypothetical protein NEPG_00026 [Nematocida parisii ERTm1]